MMRDSQESCKSDVARRAAACSEGANSNDIISNTSITRSSFHTCDIRTIRIRVIKPDLNVCSSWKMLVVVTLLSIMYIIALGVSTVNGFSVSPTVVNHRRSACCCCCCCCCNNRIARIYMTSSSNNDIDNEVGDGDLDSGGNVLHDLSWRVEKLRLEEANTRRFLKARPRYLPYDECRKWVQAWNRWENEQDWREWIDQGEKRNSYIPARPDEYYGRLGQWKGWDHFLSKVDCDDKNGKEESSFD